MQKWWRIRSEVVCKDFDKLHLFHWFQMGREMHDILGVGWLEVLWLTSQGCYSQD